MAAASTRIAPDRKGPRGRRRLLRGACVSAATLLLIAGGIEVALRLNGYDPLETRTQGRLRMIRPSDHGDLAYELLPGADEDFRGTRVQVNRLGFRGREYAVPAPPGVRRVVVLGDSIAFADRMRVEKRVSERLEALAADRGLAIEAPNLGVSGYDVVDAVASLEHLGLALEPDVVVYVVCVNDLGVQSFNLPLIEGVKRMGVLGRHSRLLQYLTLAGHQRRGIELYTRLASEDGFREHFARFIDPLPPSDPVREPMTRLADWLAETDVDLPYLSWYVSEARVGRLRHELGRLAELARTHGFEAWAGVVPYLNDKGDPEGWERAYEIVDHEIERAGLMRLDFVGDFREPGILQFYARPGGRPDPLHPNPAGHERMARTILDALAGP